MEELHYREGDQLLPIPENEKNVPAIWAEKFMDISVNPNGLNILEGLCFDRKGDLFICNTPQSRIYKLDMQSRELSVFIDLPDHMMPSAVKIHKDGRIFATITGSDHGCLVAVLSPEGKFLQEIPMEPGRMIDDMVFDADGGLLLHGPGRDRSQQNSRGLLCRPGLSNGSPGYSGRNDRNQRHFPGPRWAAPLGNGIRDRHTAPYCLAGQVHAPIGGLLHRHRFTGLEGPDSTIIDEDGNLYVALCGQARFLVFNRNGFPIGQILIPGRERGGMRKSTHLAIRPGTNEAYMCAADLHTNQCALFRAKVFANCYKSYQFQ